MLTGRAKVTAIKWAYVAHFRDGCGAVSAGSDEDLGMSCQSWQNFIAVVFLG